MSTNDWSVLASIRSCDLGYSKQPAQNPGGNSGTGFVIDRRGYVVTNAYILGGTKQVTVVLYDGKKQAASVVATDPTLDVAVLKMPAAAAAQVLSLGDSNDVQVGEAIYVLGFPPEAVPGNAVTVSDGQVSSFRHYKGERWFEITPALTPKHSGGPLVRAESRAVVGIVSWQVGEGGGEPIVFVRPIKSIRNFLTRHIK